jgi:hypothetical protein
LQPGDILSARLGPISISGRADGGESPKIYEESLTSALLADKLEREGISVNSAHGSGGLTGGVTFSRNECGTH